MNLLYLTDWVINPRDHLARMLFELIYHVVEPIYVELDLISSKYGEVMLYLISIEKKHYKKDHARK